VIAINSNDLPLAIAINCVRRNIATAVCGPADFVYRFMYMLCVSLMTILRTTQGIFNKMICAQCRQNAAPQAYMLTNTQEDTAYSAAQSVCNHSGTQTAHMDMTGTGKQSITSRISTTTHVCLWAYTCQPGTLSHCLYVLQQLKIRRNRHQDPYPHTGFSGYRICKPRLHTAFYLQW
jgi:hypothetical protein